MFRPKNNIFRNWNKELYIAKKLDPIYDDYDNQIPQYDKPKYLGKFNYQHLTARDLQSYKEQYGEVKNNLVQCLVDYDIKSLIDEFDLAYLYGCSPKDENINGEKANYVIKSIRGQNTKTLILFEEIIKED